MHNRFKGSKLEPVAIGGVGGSGTRLVAELLKRLGFFMGDDLNQAGDNECFTFLFKRPSWFRKCRSTNDDRIYRAFRLFEIAMKGRPTIAREDLYLLLGAIIPMSVRGHDHLGHGRGTWPFRRANRLLRGSTYDEVTSVGWGWKEPNTHIYLEYLSHYFKGLKYIHVIRNGLDMAYSGNQSQVFNWGWLFDVPRPRSRNDLPQRSLQYWIRSNRKAIEKGKSLLGSRFHLMNFDELTLHPEREITSLIHFLGIRSDLNIIDSLQQLAKIPSSRDRYKLHDLSCFSPSEIQAVRDFGFTIDVATSGDPS